MADRLSNIKITITNATNGGKGGGFSKRREGFTPRKDEEETGEEFIPNNVSEVLRIPSMVISGIKGMIAYKVVKETAKMIRSVGDVVIPYIANENGDYSVNRAWNNAWGMIENIFNPIGTVIGIVQREQTFRLQNMHNQEQRILWGDTALNVSLGGKKV